MPESIGTYINSKFKRVSHPSAVYALKGKKLKGRWNVLEQLPPKPGATGGFFSVCYRVVDDNGNEAFLKAINFQAFFQLFKGKNIVEILQEQTNAFQYEKNLLERCRNSRLSKVSVIIDEGEELVDGYVINQVPYLIFEMADGDIRSRIDFSNTLDVSWKLRSLHNVAVGLQQLHSIRIGHQDLKPSNILLYEGGIVSKIGDLGRSLCNDIKAPHDDGSFPGDINYAPPEFWYGAAHIDWNIKIRATDLYLFGSLIVFYFTGLKMMVMINNHLEPQFQFDKWGGTFEDVSTYLINAFYHALEEIKAAISSEDLGKDLVKMIEYCCFPISAKRGHPNNHKVGDRQYDFQRIVAQLDLLTRKWEIRLR